MISCVSIRTFSLVLLSFLLNHINTKYRSILRCDSGSTGNMTVTDLRLFSSRGYSLHDGVTRYVGKAAYYWSPVSNFSHCYISRWLIKPSVRPCGVNIFKITKLRDCRANVDETWLVYPMSGGTNFQEAEFWISARFCAARGHSEQSCWLTNKQTNQTNRYKNITVLAEPINETPKNNYREIKTSDLHMMPLLLHVCNGLAHAADESMFAGYIGTVGNSENSNLRCP